MIIIDFFKKPKRKKTTQKIETIDGVNFKFRKNQFSKCIKITIKENNCALVTLPKSASFSVARNFAVSHLDEIKKAVSKIKTPKKEEIEQLRKEAKNYLPKRLEELSKIYGYKYNKLTLKRLKTRWGSCSYNNNINLNISLMLLEKELIDYVLLHELVHTKEKNHSSGFWTKLLSDMPDARQRQALLKKKKVI